MTKFEIRGEKTEEPVVKFWLNVDGAGQLCLNGECEGNSKCILNIDSKTGMLYRYSGVTLPGIKTGANEKIWANND